MSKKRPPEDQLHEGAIARGYRVGYLVRRYFAGTMTPEEKAELDRWLMEDASHRRLLDELSVPDHREALLRELSQYDAGEGLSAILGAVRQRQTRRLTARPFLLAAASLLCIVAAAFLLHHYFRHNRTGLAVKGQQDIAPGGNRAVLTLGNGTQITLDSARQGLLARQGGISVMKAAGGRLAYTGLAIKNSPVLLNTLRTPAGGQYGITLPDGSKVMLNAASSLTYPASFTGHTREVQLTGEGYFEIAQDSRRPFLITVNGMQVEVLGTAFDVMAYGDEPSISTTLVAGRVRVSYRGQTAALKMGQATRLDKAGRLHVSDSADIAEATAWKDGYFQFDDETIEPIMRQVARWYNVEVEYRGTVSLHFVGSISRGEPVSKVLELLALTHAVRFSIEGRKIIVTPL